MTVLTLPRVATPSVAALDLPRVQRNNPLIIRKSARFNRGDTPSLTRTFTAGNRRLFGMSLWIKPARCWGDFVTGRSLINGNSGSSDTTYFSLGFDTSDRISISGYSTNWRQTSARLRDCSAWYHLVVGVDTSQATADDRIKVWLNGVQLTSWVTNNAIGLNADTGMNSSGGVFTVCSNIAGGPGEFDGNVAEVVYVDGAAVTANDFGLFDADGVWQPRRYGGMLGTNGVRLTFENSANLGLDSDGRNNLTVANLSTAAGTGNDQLDDTPSNNFAVMNRLDNATLIPLNGNLDVPAGNSRGVKGSIPMRTGKWYWEITAVGSGSSDDGICNQDFALGAYAGSGTTSVGYVATDLRYNSANLATGLTNSGTSGNVTGIEIDCDNRIMAFYVNDVLQYRGAIPFTGDILPVSSYGTGVTGYTASYNFGQRPFVYPRPGWKKLCAANLPAPAITRPRRHFDVQLYTGDASASQRSIQGLTFKPDFTIFKNRGAAANYVVLDPHRGYTQSLYTTTAAHATEGELIALDERGITVLRNGGIDRLNGSSTNMMNMAWRRGPHFNLRWVSHTNGVATTVGFETLAGNIEMAMVKRTDAVRAWSTYHVNLTAGNLMNLDSTAVEGADTSFTVSGRRVIIDSSLPTGSYLVLAWTSVDGICKVGKYAGNASSAGPYVHMNFRPRWFLVKRRAGAVANWQFLDTARNPHNNATLLRLLMNDGSIAEAAARDVDFLSNGVKIRDTDTDWNAAADYVYLAMADLSFKYGRAG